MNIQDSIILNNFSSKVTDGFITSNKSKVILGNTLIRNDASERMITITPNGRRDL